MGAVRYQAKSLTSDMMGVIKCMSHVVNHVCKASQSTTMFVSLVGIKISKPSLYLYYIPQLST